MIVVDSWDDVLVPLSELPFFGIALCCRSRRLLLEASGSAGRASLRYPSEHVMSRFN